MTHITAESAIRVEKLSRQYTTSVGIIRRQKRSINALNEVSFDVQRGELFGIVGPNGAGKSTLIKILTTMLLPSSGMAWVLGCNVASQERLLRPQINVVFGGERGLYSRLSATDNLAYFADLYKIPRDIARTRIPSLLEQVGLNGREDERVEGYSKGMKQRLHIAKALINDPAVLFLDEPTIGLDAAAARKLRELMQTLQEAGRTIILTSHYMYEVDSLCQRVAVIREGRVVALDTPYQLKRVVAKLSVIEAQIIEGTIDGDLLQRLKEVDGVENATLKSASPYQTLTIHTSKPESLDAVLAACIPSEKTLYVVKREPTLEDAYLKLVEGP